MFSNWAFKNNKIIFAGNGPYKQDTNMCMKWLNGSYKVNKPEHVQEMTPRQPNKINMFRKWALERFNKDTDVQEMGVTKYKKRTCARNGS